MEKVRKIYTGKVVSAEAGQPIIAVVSTEDVDYAGDVIYQGPNDKGAGWLLDDFNSRGRVYWMHDPLRPNLAAATAFVDGRELMLSVSFDEDDDFAMKIDRKYRKGILSEWSVGFRPVGDKFAQNDHGGFDFFEQVLDEVSAVNQGMNPNTRTISKAFEDYLDRTDEIRGRMDEYEARIRAIEAALMRGEKEEEERVERMLREAQEALNRVRTGA